MNHDTSTIRTTDCSLVAWIPIHNPGIQEAKDYLRESFGSLYGIPPHITISFTPMPEHNLLAVEREIDGYLADKPAMEIRLTGLEFDPKNRFFSVEVDSPDIRRMHKDMVSLVNRYREGFIRSKDEDRIKNGKYDFTEARNVSTYGYPRVHERFIPHITIGNIARDDSDTEKVEKRLQTILSDVIDSKIRVLEVFVTYHSSASDQALEIVSLWEKKYVLLQE